MICDMHGNTFSYDFIKISISAALTKNRAVNDVARNSMMYSPWLSRAGWTTSTKFPPAGNMHDQDLKSLKQGTNEIDGHRRD